MTKLNFEERLFIEKRLDSTRSRTNSKSWVRFVFGILIEGEKCCNLRAITLKIYSKLCHVILDKTSILSRKFSQISRFMSNEKPI